MSTYFIMAPLLAWVVWRRVHRSFGRQPIQRKRMILRIVVFAVIGVLLALSGLQKIALAEGLFAGVLVGALIGTVGLRLTRFETDPVRGDCYIPNPWIGALLTALLIGRLAWRFVVLLPGMHQAPATATQIGDRSSQTINFFQNSSPLTLLVVGLLVGYYIVYFTGLLIHHRRFQRSQMGTAAF